MKSYTIVPVTGEIDWEKVPALGVDTVLWEPECGISMTAQLCYDPQNLYVHLRAVEENIRAEHIGELQQVCEDSCMEFFFAPGEGEDLRYFNLEINPNGCVHLGFRRNRQESTNLVLKKMTEQLGVRAGRTEDGWELFYHIPLSLMTLFYPGYAWEKGKCMRANFYKCGDLTVKPHFLSWNPVSSESPDFHRPVDFGQLYFG